MAEQGSKILAVSDSSGAIHNPDGLDIKRLVDWKAEHGTVVGFPGSTRDHERGAARGRVRRPDPGRAGEPDHRAQNAERINAKIVAEAANGPTTPEADEILFRRGIFMIPDILCNAGGVTVSYFEWVQDLNRDHWSLDVVNDKLHEIMTKAFAETLEIAEREQVHMRMAAYLLAVERVSSATALRGLYP